MIAGWLGFVEFRRIWGGEGSIPEPSIIPYMFNSIIPARKTVTPPVDTAQHGVETPSPLADR